MTDVFLGRVNTATDTHRKEAGHVKMKAELEVSDTGWPEKYQMPGERWKTDPLPAFRRTNHAHKLTLEFYPAFPF